MNKWKTFGLCMAVAGTVSLCAVGVTAGASSVDGGIEKTVLGSTEEVNDENLSVAEVVKNSMPSMVSITNTSVQQVIDYFGGSGDMFDFFFNDFFGGYGYGDGFNNRGGDDRSRVRETVSAGSGVIIGEKEDDPVVGITRIPSHRSKSSRWVPPKTSRSAKKSLRSAMRSAMVSQHPAVSSAPSTVKSRAIMITARSRQAKGSSRPTLQSTRAIPAALFLT